jgi:signal recognition particle subunit SRP19
MPKGQKVMVKVPKQQSMPMRPPFAIPELPPRPDPNTKIYYPKEDYLQGLIDESRYTCIWPAYLDSQKTVAEGRRVPKELACDKPLTDDIAYACLRLSLRHVIEPYKQYPRDWNSPGRVKVQIHEKDGSLINPEIPTKNALLLKLAELIPQLPTRIQRLEKKKEEQNKSVQQQQSKQTASDNKKSSGRKKHGKHR